MKHRQFKKECICTTMINGREITCKNLERIKNIIYEQGRRGNNYNVAVKRKKTNEIYDLYIYKFTKEGPIFTKQIYSKWKMLKLEAESKQYNIFIE